MKKLERILLAGVLAALPLTHTMAADGDFSATVGLKVWNNNWSSWTGNIDLFGDPLIQNIESSTENALIPSFSMRYRDFMVGGSYMTKTDYDFGENFGEVERKEYDIIGGYYVLPTLAIIAGYKKVEQEFANGNFKYSGPIVGLSASAPLTGGFSLYGTAASSIGNFKGQFPSGRKEDSSYRLGEVGVAYAFDVGASLGVKALIATFGYRSQAIVTKNIFPGMKGRDTTEGFALGFAAAF